MRFWKRQDDDPQEETTGPGEAERAEAAYWRDLRRVELLKLGLWVGVQIIWNLLG